MPRALVTGANGHIGSNLVRELLSRDWEVAGFVRTTSDLRSLEGLDVTLHRGDVLDGESVHAAMDDWDCVFHTATAFKLWAKDRDDIVQPAIRGTRNVLEAAARHGASRVVFTSSQVALGANREPEPRDETAWNEDYRSPYVTAKTESEQLAHALAADLGVDLIAVQPGNVLGRHDYRITPSQQGVVDVLEGKGMWLEGGINIVSVQDVACGMVLAADRGEPGERYALGGDNLTHQAWLEMLAERADVRVRPAPPTWLLKILGTLMAWNARLTGRPPSLTPELVHDYADRWWWIDPTRSREALGFEARPATDVADETLRWLAFVGVLDGDRQADLSRRFPPDPAWTA